MKRALALIFVCALGVRLRADTAGVSVISFSVQIEPATVREPLTDLETTLSVSSSGNDSDPNGELAPAGDNVPFSHQSFFILPDPTTLEPSVIPFGLDVPGPDDVNHNGVADFFDRDLETAGVQTSGQHGTFVGPPADFTAKWTRAAGQSSGTVIFDFPFLGMTSTHEYRILQQEGQFIYSRNDQTITGTVVLTNLLADEQISGPLSLTITNENQLGYASGVWTNVSGSQYTFTSIDSLDRAGTNYVAFIGFDDGYPASSEADYNLWFLVIHSADANSNGILDLIEATTDKLRLEIRKITTGIEITVHGAAGASYVLEGSDILASGSWSTAQSVTLDNGADKAVQLPVASVQKFFRLRQN